ncbi:MAG: DinB family protein [Gemmatimonadales bacterium]|nr:DinB family protein [Gemmatimonadales bacterium]
MASACHLGVYVCGERKIPGCRPVLNRQCHNGCCIADAEDVVAVLDHQAIAVAARLSAIPEARGAYRYAPGKWSVKDVVGHLCDTERVFAYRALRIARGDPTPLPSFDDATGELGEAYCTLGYLCARPCDARVGVPENGPARESGRRPAQGGRARPGCLRCCAHTRASRPC